MTWRNAVMKVMYVKRVKVLMMANMLHVRFVGRNPVEAVQHLRSETRHPSASTGSSANKRLYNRHWN